MYMPLIIVSAIFVFLAHPSSSPPPPSPPPPSPPPPPQISYAVLALQWAKGVCHTTTCKTAPPASLSAFTLHGIWPKDSQGTDLTMCPAELYDSNRLQPLLADLQTYWPSFQKSNDDFWKHEWQKHGTCSGMSLVGFFQAALAAIKPFNHDLMAELKNKGISPSTTLAYAIKDCRDNVDKAVQKSHCIYQLTCNKKAKNEYLIEVRVCLDRTLNNFIACPQTAKDSCLNNAILYM